MSLVDAAGQPPPRVHRKPLPQPGVNTRVLPPAQFVQNEFEQYPQQPAMPPPRHVQSEFESYQQQPTMPQARQPISPPPSQPHSRNPSASTYASAAPPQIYQTSPPPLNPRAATRRTSSGGTSSTASNGLPARKTSNASTTLQRTISGRSGNSTAPLSYVALLRKQRATVWCDRAQHEDPRVAAKQRAEKARAAMEVSGPGLSVRAGYGADAVGARSKARYGATKVKQFSGLPHPASGVPLRLSAREVDDDDSDEDSARGTFHRPSSGRSSFGSQGRVPSGYALQAAMQGGRSSDSSTPSVSRGHSGASKDMADGRVRSMARSSMSTDVTSETTPVPGQSLGPDYFSQQRKAPSANSGSTDSETERKFGTAEALPRKSQAAIDEEEARRRELDVQRRGSVDERSMTMKGYSRLFVANPDVND